MDSYSHCSRDPCATDASAAISDRTGAHDVTDERCQCSGQASKADWKSFIECCLLYWNIADKFENGFYVIRRFFNHFTVKNAHRIFHP
jgi:hypothetical protein